MKKYLLPFVLIILLIIAAVALGAVKEIMTRNVSSDSNMSISEETPVVVEDKSSEVSDSMNENKMNTDPKLLGKTWMWVRSYKEGSSESFIEPIQETAFTITFNEDGSVGGTTDCNNFSGTYTLSGNRISFGPMMQTLMYCENSQESAFLSQLQDIEEYSFYSDDQLVLGTQDMGMEFK
ncbi:META domain-containing protein [Candidatus Nomurabacteria bacterium]|nr:META domain-containing protein [Candidatus Nomurabacteria bacterium]